MSREERRAYQRQMRGMDRGPALPPAARARAERVAAKRQQRQPSVSADGRPAPLDRRFWIRAILVAVVLGYVAFSLQWSEGMPRAAYVGLAVTAIVLVLSIGFRYIQRRMPTTRP